MLRARSALVLGVAAAVGVAGTGCADQSAAIRVGDDTVSEQDFVVEVETLRDNETVLQLIVDSQATRADLVGELSDDSFRQPFVGYMVEQRVLLILQAQLAAQEGVEPSEADLDGVRGQVESELETAEVDIADLPESFVDQLVGDIAVNNALQELPTEDIQEAFLELADTTDVELSSHLGEWDAESFLAGLQGQTQEAGAVTPPPAPQPASGEEDGADLGSPAG